VVATHSGHLEWVIEVALGTSPSTRLEPTTWLNMTLDPVVRGSAKLWNSHSYGRTKRPWASRLIGLAIGRRATRRARKTQTMLRTSASEVSASLLP
jgi:hypothetical protein